MPTPQSLITPFVGAKPGLHPDFVPTAEQRLRVVYLRDRLTRAIDRHADRPFLTSRANMMLRGLNRAAGTQDRVLLGQWLHEWTLAIEGQCGTMERWA